MSIQDLSASSAEMHGLLGAMQQNLEFIQTLEDELALRPGKEPFDPAVANPDPRGSLRMIEAWLGEETAKLDGLVKRFWALAEEDRGLAAPDRHHPQELGHSKRQYADPFSTVSGERL
jgi:hypothetical protein